MRKSELSAYVRARVEKARAASSVWGRAALRTASAEPFWGCRSPYALVRALLAVVAFHACLNGRGAIADGPSRADLGGHRPGGAVDRVAPRVHARRAIRGVWAREAAVIRSFQAEVPRAAEFDLIRLRAVVGRFTVRVRVRVRLRVKVRVRGRGSGSGRGRGIEVGVIGLGFRLGL